MSLVPSHPTVSPTLPCLSGFLLSAVSPASHLSVDAGLPWSTVSVLPCPDLRTCLNLCTLPALPVANPEFSPLASLRPLGCPVFLGYVACQQLRLPRCLALSLPLQVLSCCVRGPQFPQQQPAQVPRLVVPPGPRPALCLPP